MKTLGASTVLLLWFVLLGLPSGDRASGTAPTVPLQELGVAALADTADPTGVVRRYCVRCHNERLLRGNLTLEEFDVETAHERAPTAEKMIRKLRAGMMPPPDQRRPPPATLRALVETLETVVDREAAHDRNPGSRRFQRLNRAEYERVIRDLLDIEIDAGRWLPADTYLGAFDNMSDAQGLSTTLPRGLPEGRHGGEPARRRHPGRKVEDRQIHEPDRRLAARLGSYRGHAVRDARRNGRDP